jgi:hypothetical protein
MTYKKLMDELSGVAVSDYKEVINFIQELKSKKIVSAEDMAINGLVDWTVADDNWNEKEIW